jgi:hypothetical protein
MITVMRRYPRLLLFGLLLVIGAFVLTSVFVGALGVATRPIWTPTRASIATASRRSSPSSSACRSRP